MEKRIPLAFFLSFVILFGWQFLFGPKTPPGGPDDATRLVDEVPSTHGVPGAQPEASPAGASTDEVSGISAPGVASEPEAEPWREWLELGVPGQPGHYYAQFDNRGGVLLDLHIGDYWVRRDLSDADKDVRENCVKLASGIETTAGMIGSFGLAGLDSVDEFTGGKLDEVRWDARVLTGDGGADIGVEFVHDGGRGLVFYKRIRVVPGRYELELDVAIEAREGLAAGGAGRLGFRMVPAMGVRAASADSFYVEPTARVGFYKSDELRLSSEAREFGGDERSGEFPPSAGETAFAGVDNKYFAMLLRGADAYSKRSIQGAGWRRVFDPAWVKENPTELQNGFRVVASILHLDLEVPAAGKTNEYRYTVFAGPKSRTILEEHNPDHVVLIRKDLGFFDGIASMLLKVLGWFHSIAGNWGVSIILLTLFVRIVLFPFNRRSQTAMARHATKMERVQPLLNEIKKLHEKDPKKLRQEQARIMQEEGAFPPLGGCLPMFVQIPIFFGLFSALRTSFELRQAPFMGWIQDLSAPDRFMKLGLDLPLIGEIEYLNILPPAMVILWILQQKLMPKPTDEQALRMQKMMMFMPIIFGFFLYNYAAGLSLYMITTSLFGIAEHTVIKKMWPLDKTERPKKKSGFMSRLAELQQEAARMQKAKQQGGGGGGGKRNAKRPPKKAKRK